MLLLFVVDNNDDEHLSELKYPLLLTVEMIVDEMKAVSGKVVK